MYLVVLLVLVFLGGSAFVRLAPTQADQWHTPIKGNGYRDMRGGAIRVQDATPGALAKIDAAARALPRTKVLAGSVTEGRITYVTRSALWGFPDFTTVEYADGQLKLFGRLRFGRSDFGVNAKRLEGLIAALER